MKKLMDKLQKFMANRNGLDTIGIVYFACYCALLFSSIFYTHFVIYIFEGLFAALFILRVFSKNVTKRRAENWKFICFFQKFKRKKKSYDPNHVIKKCPKCKQKLRLKREPGKHTVVCPKCNHRFLVKIKKK